MHPHRGSKSASCTSDTRSLVNLIPTWNSQIVILIRTNICKHIYTDISKLIIDDFAYFEHSPFYVIDSPLIIDMIPRPGSGLHGTGTKFGSAVPDKSVRGKEITK